METASSSRIQTIFSNAHNPLSPMVRAVTRGEWSHVAMYNEETGMVMESTWGGGGVKPISIDGFTARASEYAIVYTNSPMEVWAAAMSQLGKKYDKTALLGIGFNRDWQEDDAWYCSEYWNWCHLQAGIQYFRPEVKAIFPQHAWMVLKNKTTRVRR